MDNFEAALQKLDKNGLLILQIALGQRAIELLQQDKEPKPKSSLVLPSQPLVGVPNDGLICPPVTKK